MIRDNKAIGRNIVHFRQMNNKKASEVANAIGMKEAAYTKHERGETELNVTFIIKVATVLHVNPLRLLISDPDQFMESLAITHINL